MDSNKQNVEKKTNDEKNTNLHRNKQSLYGNKYVNILDGELQLDKIKVNKIVESFGTPTFIFLEQKIRDNINKIQDCFKEIFPTSIGFYSTKSNFLPEIAQIMKEKHFGAEIIGLPELRMLKKIDFSKNNIIAGGPYLPNRFLEEILKDKIPYIVVYDILDIIRINEQLEQLNSIEKQDIIIRFQTPKYTGRQGIAFTTENMDMLRQTLAKCPNIQIKGILSHMGTQLNTLESYMKNIEFIIMIANYLKNELNIQVDIFNIGGGFPNADSLKKKQLKSMLMEVQKKLKEENWEFIKIFYEPGRNIVGDAGFCLAKVYRVNRTHSTIFLDVGNNIIPKFMKSSLRFYNVEKINDSANSPFDFMGNIPSDQDILVKKYNFTPSVSIGNHVLIANTGAYALTWSTRFPYSLPNIVFIKGKEIKPIFLSSDSDDFSLR